jgi:predicted RNA-binding Zn-ribbon protein involved in translation (DUF1610 family)
MTKDLMVECKACGREFVEAAPDEFIDAVPQEEEASKGPLILGNTIVYSCPLCGSERTYRRDEMRLAD